MRAHAAYLIILAKHVLDETISTTRTNDRPPRSTRTDDHRDDAGRRPGDGDRRPRPLARPRDAQPRRRDDHRRRHDRERRRSRRSSGTSKLDSTAAEWINAIYTLVFAALLITLGRIGDVLGRRAMYLAGLVIFVARLDAGRPRDRAARCSSPRACVQGVGGAMILPATQSILNANFRGRDRAIAFGIWGAVIGGMAAVGPLLGGWLTTNLSWRWAFFINLPIGILAIVGTLRYIGESRDEHAQAGFDLPGFVLITRRPRRRRLRPHRGPDLRLVGAEPEHPFTVARLDLAARRRSPSSRSPSASASLSLLLFAVVEIRRQRAGKFFLFDFGLWRYRAFRFGNLAGTIVSLGEFGLLFALPLFLQAVLGYDAFETGLIFLSLAVGLVLRGSPVGDARAPLRPAPGGHPGHGAGGRRHLLHDASSSARRRPASCSRSRSSSTASASASRRRSSPASSSPTSRRSGPASRPGRTRRCARSAPPWASRSWGPSCS